MRSFYTGNSVIFIVLVAVVKTIVISFVVYDLEQSRGYRVESRETPSVHTLIFQRKMSLFTLYPLLSTSQVHRYIAKTRHGLDKPFYIAVYVIAVGTDGAVMRFDIADAVL